MNKPTFTLQQYLDQPDCGRNLVDSLGMDEFDAMCELAEFISEKSYYSDTMSRGVRFYQSCERQIINRHIESGKFHQGILDNTNTYFELKKKDSNRGVAVLPTVNDYEKPWKLAYFDENGPIYHQTFESRDDAVICALKDGYTEVCEDLMDTLSNKLEWKKGSHITEMLRLGMDPFKELKNAQEGSKEATGYGIQLATLIKEMNSHNCESATLHRQV